MTVDANCRAITVRRIEEGTYRALKSRARHNSRSMEAEVRQILTDTVLPEPKTLADLAALLPDLNEVPYVRSQETFSPEDVW